jgi:predicted phosphodiesterase
MTFPPAQHPKESGLPLRRLGLIGDVHGEHERLANALDWFVGQGVDAIVCTGDVADGAGCINACCDLLQQAEVITVAGNHDRWLLQDRVRHLTDAHHLDDLTETSRDFLQGLPQIVSLQTMAGAMVLCHGVLEDDLGKVWPGTERSPIERSGKMDNLLAAGSHKLLVNGHMHYRVLIDFHELVMINAGTLRGPFSGVSLVDFEGDWVSAHEPGPDGRAERVAEHSLVDNGERRVWRDTQEFDGAWQPVTLHT